MVFSKIKLVEKNLITISVLLVMDKRMESNIGLLEILGVAIGVKVETSDSLEVSTILELKAPVHGLILVILGQKIKEITLNQVQKI